MDKTRDDAKHACLAKKADLVSIETEEELEFIKDQIRIKVREKGQHMLNNDQWWTNGISYKLSHWVWDTPMARQGMCTNNPVQELFRKDMQSKYM